MFGVRGIESDGRSTRCLRRGCLIGKDGGIFFTFSGGEVGFMVSFDRGVGEVRDGVYAMEERSPVDPGNWRVGGWCH